MKRYEVISLGLIVTFSLISLLEAHKKPDLEHYSKDAKDDHVESLPGWGTVDHFKLFSGYVTVDEEAGRSLFYALAESASDTPDTDPLVLWLNGGPGCSSIGGGFLSELGPFYPKPGGKLLKANKYAWNKVANVLFLESPAFVGFSYSNTSADAIVGDARTADDSLEFLLRFFKRFPQYAHRPLHLSGESYAGHYIPNLAQRILRYNKKADKDAQINFQGFLVGNAWTDAPTENRAAVDFWHNHGIISSSTKHGIVHNYSQGALDFWLSHGLISFDIHRGINKYCDFGAIDPLSSSSTVQERTSLLNDDDESVDPAFTSFTRRRQMMMDSSSGNSLHLKAAVDNKEISSRAEKCDAYLEESSAQFKSINIYDIYADICIPPSVSAPARQLINMVYGRSFDRLQTPSSSAVQEDSSLLAVSSLKKADNEENAKYDPCVDDELTIYLNRPDVQKALHANVTGSLPGPWMTCTPIIQYSRDDILASMLPVYDELLESGIRMLVYSGDVDAIVPIIGTRRWIADFKLDVKETWRAWKSATGQVGGWVEVYDKGLTFASVRNSGHMVPYTQPERAFHMFSHWIHNKSF